MSAQRYEDTEGKLYLFCGLVNKMVQAPPEYSHFPTSRKLLAAAVIYQISTSLPLLDWALEICSSGYLKGIALQIKEDESGTLVDWSDTELWLARI